MDDACDGVDKGSDRWLRDCELSTGPVGRDTTTFNYFCNDSKE